MLKVLLLILLLCCLATVSALIGAHLNLHPLVPDAVADRILVEKAARRLTLLRGGRPLPTLGTTGFDRERRTGAASLGAIGVAKLVAT